jgi:NADH-quinone oxidoreductase subunit E
MSLLSSQSVASIEDLRRREPSAQCVLLTALRLTQLERHRVGVEEVEELAALLGLSTATVEGVARFYDQISCETTGSHVLSLCRGIACSMRGAEARAGELCETLGIAPGETTTDGHVTFKLVECIGDCDHAPAVMLDDTFLGAATAADVRSLLDRS